MAIGTREILTDWSNPVGQTGTRNSPSSVDGSFSHYVNHGNGQDHLRDASAKKITQPIKHLTKQASNQKDVKQIGKRLSSNRAASPDHPKIRHKSVQKSHQTENVQNQFDDEDQDATSKSALRSATGHLQNLGSNIAADPLHSGNVLPDSTEVAEAAEGEKKIDDYSSTSAGDMRASATDTRAIRSSGKSTIAGSEKAADHTAQLALNCPTLQDHAQSSESDHQTLAPDQATAISTQFPGSAKSAIAKPVDNGRSPRGESNDEIQLDEADQNDGANQSNTTVIRSSNNDQSEPTYARMRQLATNDLTAISSQTSSDSLLVHKNFHNQLRDTLAPAGILISDAQSLHDSTHSKAEMTSPNSAVPYSALPVEIGLRSLSGQKEISIDLSPEELGKINVVIGIDHQSKSQVNFYVDQPQTLTLLQHDAPTIRHALEQAGITTGDSGLQFSMSQNNSSNSGSHGHGQNAAKDQSKRPSHDGRLIDASPIDATATTAFRRISLKHLDLSV